MFNIKKCQCNFLKIVLLEESDDQDDVGNYVEETTLKAENEERADLHQLLDELDDRQGRDGQTFEDSDGEPAVQPKSPTNQNREESQTEQKRAEARQALANSIVDARMPQSNSDHAIVNFINADIRSNIKKKHKASYYTILASKSLMIFIKMFFFQISCECPNPQEIGR